MRQLRMAVIGVGHLGKEHARILSNMPDVDLVGVADAHPAQAEMIAERCGTRAFDHYEQLLDEADAVSVVTPTVAHFEVAKAFLERGKPVLVEKPIAATVQQAREMVELSERHGAILQVGHIERFNPAFEELQRRPIQTKFVECERHGPFTGRSIDIGAVLDLMIHDLDLLLALNRGSAVLDVEAVGAPVFGGHEDMVNARLKFANGCIAHVTASRVSQRPKRRMRIWAPEGYAGIDFVQKRLILVQRSQELQRNGLHLHSLDQVSRARLKEEIFGRHLEVMDLNCTRPGDQLTAELAEFVQCVRTGTQPRVPGTDGLAALELAERVVAALSEHAWDGVAGQALGAFGMPGAVGRLFERQAREAA